MTDIESELRDLLNEMALKAGPPGRLPTTVRRGVQLRRLTIAGGFALASVGLILSFLLVAGNTPSHTTHRFVSPSNPDVMQLPGKPLDIQYGAGAVWISSYRTRDGHEYGIVTRIDPATGATSTYRLGRSLSGLSIAASREGVFVLQNANTGRFAQLGSRSARIIHRFTPPGGPDLLAGGGSLWVGDCNGGPILRLDPSTHRVVARVASVASGPTAENCPQLFAHGAVWLLSTYSHLSRLDPRTNTIDGGTSVPFTFSEGTLEAFGASPGRVWATFSNRLDGRARIVGVNAKTGLTAVSRLSLPAANGQIRAVAADSRHVWLAVPGRILWLDPATLRIQKVTRVSDPVDLSLVGKYLWVLQRSEGERGSALRIPVR